MRHSIFTSWSGQIAIGLGLIFSSLEIAWLLWEDSWEILAGCGALAIIGSFAIFLAERRQYPIRLARKACRSLNLPSQWAVKFNKRVPNGGVIPVAVIRSDGVRFMIDVRDYKDALWSHRVGDPEFGQLLAPTGKPFSPDPVRPLLEAASTWNATAILWLPEAMQRRNLRRDGCKLIVVMGTARDLKHALQSAEIVTVQQESTSVSAGQESTFAQTRPAAQRLAA